MSERAKFVGINHIALEVDDIDAALEFYGQLFEFELRGRHGTRMAFVDAGDQFIAFSAPRRQAGADESRHFGLVVDDKEAVRAALERGGVEILPGRGLDFRDPSGNLVQIVQYDEIQFTKTEPALRAWGSAASARARRRKGRCAKRACCERRRALYCPAMTDLRGNSTFAVANLPVITVVLTVVEAELKCSVVV